MPIDANIIFQQRSPDFVNALTSGFKAGNDMMMQPSVNAMFREKLALAQGQTEEQVQKNDDAKYLRQLRDMAIDAGPVKNALARGDFALANSLMGRHVEKIIDRDDDPSDSMEFWDRLRSGQMTPQQAIGELDSVILSAKQAGAFGSVADAGMTEYQRQRLDLERKKEDRLNSSGGPTGGGNEAWAMNTLLYGDPTSKEFAAAKSFLTQPKMQAVQTDQGVKFVSVPGMDLSWVGAGAGSAAGKPAILDNPINPSGSTQQPAVPPAIIPDGVSGSGGTIPGTQRPPTVEQNQAAGLLNQATHAYKNVKKALEDDPSALDPSLAEKAVGSVFGETAQRYITSDARQRVEQAIKSMAEAVLRAATGAGVNQEEAKQKVEELTPLLGEKAGVIKQKLEGMSMYLNSLRVRSGSAGDFVEKVTPIETGAQGGKESNQAVITDPRTGKKYINISGTTYEVQD